MTPRDLIDTLGLQPHPEGGWYRETWRSAAEIPAEALPEGFAGGARACLTAIHFLLEAGSFSALHRIASDELWCFHAGDPLEVVSLSADDAPAQVHRLGPPPQGAFSAVVPAGHTFGARVAEGGAWSLVTCAVAPGFDFRDFAMPSREHLLAAFPSHRELVLALTRERG